MRKAIGISFITVLGVLFLGLPTYGYTAAKKYQQCGTTAPAVPTIQCFQEYNEKDKNGNFKRYLSDREMDEKSYALRNGDLTQE